MTNDTQRKHWPSRDAPQRLTCPTCGCTHLPVLNTRHSEGQTVRYHRCRHCGWRITTYERAAGAMTGP